MLSARTLRRVLLTALAFGLVSACARAAQDSTLRPDRQDFSTIERGRYLATVGDCAACHTKPGGPQLAGGRPIETPFGNLIAPNITPDFETGIGSWSDDDFVAAMTKGINKSGAHLYPGMPYPYFAKATRKDILAIHAYLQTVPPVHNAVDTNQLPFPFNIRAAMIGWNALFFKPGPFKPLAGKSAEWNRGAYLVEGLMHCGACHTPKNFLGADVTDDEFAGSPLQGWFAPNLTTDKAKGVGGWSNADLVTYLRTGHNRMADASGPMAEVISRSTSQLREGDVQAIATYLLDHAAPSHDRPAPLAATDATMKMGAAIYKDECSACHSPSGEGVPGLFPKLAGAPFVQSDDATSLIHVVLHGGQSVATAAAPTGPSMPPFGWLLDDKQAAAVITYIRNSWGNAAKGIDPATIGDQRADLAKRVN